MDMKRFCRKCELAKQYGGDAAAYVERYLMQIKPEEQAEDGVYEERLKHCADCGYLLDTMCRACGCYVQLRAALKGQQCPYKKW